MKHKIIITIVSALFISISIGLVIYISNSSVALIDTKGVVADRQRDLMLFATILSLVVLIPVYIMIFAFAWRYKEGNNKAAYTPNWDSNKKLEFIWWGVPIVIIAVLSVITWQTSHSLDPYKPLASDKKPITIQVVSLQWRWLFIYPEHSIATINYVQIPKETPIEFLITGDSPMNTFWIPRLGGMIYAMNGMQTKLHLMANEEGTYEGLSGNISGEGFANMKFITRATSQSDFDNWVNQVSKSTNGLDWNIYKELSKPSKDTEIKLFSATDNELYNKIIMQFMMPNKYEQINNVNDATIKHGGM